MHHFKSPPNWPAPPSSAWQPPPGWRPDPTWPPAPPGWRFWLNERGGRSIGPRGLYGSVGRGRLAAAGIAGGLILLFVLGAIGGGNTGQAAQAGRPVPGPTATATATATATVTVRETVPGPTATVTQPPLPARTVTAKPPTATTQATRPVPLVQPTKSVQPRKTTAAPSVYYANCSAARAAGVTPLHRGDPGYASHLDRDNDGVACE